jgi:uncharacterized HAD superfamily protein
MHTISRVPNAQLCKQNVNARHAQVPEVITHTTELWFEDSQNNSLAKARAPISLRKRGKTTSHLTAGCRWW